MVICLECGADLHMAQLMPLPLTVSCFSEIQIGFTFLVPAHPGSPGQRAVKRVCVCVCMVASVTLYRWCMVVSATFKYDKPRVKCGTRAQPLFTLGSSYLNVAQTTMLNLFCRMASQVVSVLDSGAEGPGFKLQPRCCWITVLGKLFTPIVPLFTKQQNW